MRAFMAKGDKARAFDGFVRDKAAAYGALPAEEKTKLDRLIASCKE